MTHDLAEQLFYFYQDAIKLFDPWIALKDVSFSRRGIYMLPERWAKVVASDGQYFQLRVFYLFLEIIHQFSQKRCGNLFNIPIDLKILGFLFMNYTRDIISTVYFYIEIFLT